MLNKFWIILAVVLWVGCDVHAKTMDTTRVTVGPGKDHATITDAENATDGVLADWVFVDIVVDSGTYNECIDMDATNTSEKARRRIRAADGHFNPGPFGTASAVKIVCNSAADAIDMESWAIIEKLEITHTYTGGGGWRGVNFASITMAEVNDCKIKVTFDHQGIQIADAPLAYAFVRRTVVWNTATSVTSTRAGFLKGGNGNATIINCTSVGFYNGMNTSSAVALTVINSISYSRVGPGADYGTINANSRNSASVDATAPGTAFDNQTFVFNDSTTGDFRTNGAYDGRGIDASYIGVNRDIEGHLGTHFIGINAVNDNGNFGALPVDAIPINKYIAWSAAAEFGDSTGKYLHCYRVGNVHAEYDSSAVCRIEKKSALGLHIHPKWNLYDSSGVDDQVFAMMNFGRNPDTTLIFNSYYADNAPTVTGIRVLRTRDQGMTILDTNTMVPLSTRWIMPFGNGVNMTSGRLIMPIRGVWDTFRHVVFAYSDNRGDTWDTATVYSYGSATQHLSEGAAIQYGADSIYSIYRNETTYEYVELRCKANSGVTRPACGDTTMSGIFDTASATARSPIRLDTLPDGRWYMVYGTFFGQIKVSSDNGYTWTGLPSWGSFDSVIYYDGDYGGNTINRLHPASTNYGEDSLVIRHSSNDDESSIYYTLYAIPPIPAPAAASEDYLDIIMRRFRR